MADTIDFDPTDAKPVEGGSDRIDFDASDAKPAKEVGAAAAGGRGFGESAGRLVKGLGIIAGGTVGALVDKISGAISGQPDTTVSDAIFRTADEIGKSTKEYYGIKNDETLTTAGKVTHVAGGIGPVLAAGPAAPALLGGSEAVNTASDVLERGGTNAEANQAAAVAGVANTAAAAIPMGAGKVIANKIGLQNVVTRTVAGAAGGAATQVPTGMAQRTVQNASLPERPEFKDMQQPVMETTTDLVTGAVFGAIAPGRAGGARAKVAKPEAQGFDAVKDQMQEVQTPNGVEYEAPNGATITPEMWDGASERVRAGWLKPDPDAAKAAEVQVEETPVEEIQATDAPQPTSKPKRVEELERLREMTQDEEVRADLDKQIKKEFDTVDATRKAEEKRQSDLKKSEEYARLAELAEDPELKASLEEKAKSLAAEKEDAPTTKGLEVEEQMVEEVTAEPVADQVSADGLEVRDLGTMENVEATPVAAATGLEAAQTRPSTERRTDAARRKTIAEMTPDEMKRELLTSRVTEISNRRAYDEAPKKPVQTSVDADSLKWFNDTLGHDVGDDVLRRIGRVFREEAPNDSYHFSGDEFHLQGNSVKQNEAIMLRVAKRLEKERIEVTAPDGTVVIKDGIGVSYGHGKDITEAERGLQRHKAERERAGVRPGRGAEPQGVRKIEPRKADSGGQGRLDAGVRREPAQRVDDQVARPEEVKVEEVAVTDADQNATEALARSLGKSGAKDLAMRAVPHEFAEAGKNGAELRTARELAEKAFGKKIVYVDQDKPLFNGAYLPSAPDTLFLSTKTERPALAVTGHELLHAMRRDRPDIYADLRETLNGVLKNERDYSDELNAKRKARGMKELDTDTLSEELIADVVGDRFTEPAFWDQMAKQDPARFKQIAQAVLDWIKDAIAKVSGAKGPETGKYLRDLKQAQTAVADALKKYSEGETPARGAGADDVNLSLSAQDAPKDSTLGRVKAWADHALDYLNRQFADNISQVKKVGDTNTHELETLMHGRTTERLTDLKRKYIEPIQKLAAEAGVARDDVSDYLYAKHAPEANAYLAANQKEGLKRGLSGMTDEQAAQIVGSFTPEQRATLDKIGDLVQEMNRGKLDAMVEEGLISPKQRDDLNSRFKNYVSLRNMDDDTLLGFSGGGSKGLGVSGKEFKIRGGRTSKAEDPLSMTIRDAMLAVGRAEKNRVAQSFVKFVEQNHNPELAEPVTHANYPKRAERLADGTITEYKDPGALMHDPEYFGAKIDGEQRWVRIKDPMLAEQLNALGDSGLPDGAIGAVFKGLNMVTRIQSRLFTQLSADFLLSNPVRDIQQGLVVATGLGKQKGNDLAFKMLKHLPSALKESAAANLGALFGKELPTADAALYRQFRMDGGTTGGFGLDDARSIQAGMEQMIRAARGDKGAKVLVTAKKLLDPITALNDSFENMSRFAVYKAALDQGLSRQKAAVIAKNVTVNFNKRGQASPILNSLYAFFNASVQANLGLARAVKNSRTAQAALLGLFAAGVAQGLYTGEEDEAGVNTADYLSGIQRDRNLQFTFGDKGVKIPLAYGLQIPFAVGRRAARMMRGLETPGQAAGEILKLALSTFAPTGGLTPTAFQPAADVARNRSFAGAMIAKENSYDKSTPASSQHWADANPAFVAFFEALNDATGGSKNVKGLIDVSPEKAQYLFKQHMGGAALPFELSALALKDKEPTLNEIPVLRRFAYERREQFYQSEAAKKVKVATEKELEAQDNGVELPGEQRNYLNHMNALRRELRTEARKLTKLKEEGAGEETLTRQKYLVDETAKRILRTKVPEGF